MAANNQRRRPTVYDDYEYKIKSRYKEKINYVCCNPDCPAKGFVENEQMTLTRAHNHPPDPEKIEIKNFKDLLWAEAVSTSDSPKTIYERLATENPVVSRDVPFEDVERLMNRWREGRRPGLPPNLISYGEIINAEQWRQYRQYPAGQLEFHSIPIDEDDGQNSEITIIGDPGFLSSLDGITELYIDATFREVPRKPKIEQFLTIMGRYLGTPIALAWALMTRKTENSYNAVLNYFRNTLAPHIVPTTVHVDFERGLKNAILRTYPDTRVIPCYFHYSQAIYRKLQQVRGKAGIKKLAGWDIALAFYRKILGLPLLPAGDIRNGYYWLIRTAPPDVLTFFEEVLAYYERWWLNSVTPEGFSMFRISERTNNFIEAYHRILHTRMGIHPGIWKFTVNLKSVQAFIRIEAESLERGLQIRRTRRQEYANREAILTHMWTLYENGIMDISRFLACYNHVSPAFDNDILIPNVAEFDRFFTMPNHNTAVHRVLNEDLNIFGLREDQAIPILRRNAAEANLQILMLNDINHSLCPRCRKSILNVVSLPCGHWYFCQDCTTLVAQEAFDRRIQVLCRVCANRTVVFQTIQIS